MFFCASIAFNNKRTRAQCFAFFFEDIEYDRNQTIYMNALDRYNLICIPNTVPSKIIRTLCGISNGKLFHIIC